MKKGRFDEKQRLDRARACQRGFFAALIVDAILYTVICGFEVPVNPDAVFAAALWIPMLVCIVSMICLDAYEGVGEPPETVLMCIFGLAGLAMLAFLAKELFVDGEAFIENGGVTENVGHLLIALCMITVCVVYFVKRRKNSKMFKEDKK